MVWVHMDLAETIRGFYYPQASAILIFVVTVMDLLFRSLRKRVI